MQTSAGTGTEALREGALVVGALPRDLAARVDHVDVQTVDEISLAAARRPRGRVGERGAVRAEGRRCSPTLLAAVDAQHYDVSVPGQPTTR